MLLDSPAPPSKRRRLQSPHGDSVESDESPHVRDSADIRGLRARQERQFSSTIPMHGTVRAEPVEDSDYTPSIEDWQRDFFTPPGRGPNAENLEWNPACSPKDRQHDEAYLAKLDRVVAERTDNVKQEELAENDPGSRQPPVPRRAPRGSSANGPFSTTCIANIPKGLSDRLVSAYLTREYVNLPIFDLSEFKSAYEASRAGENATNTPGSFRETLNIVFSVASLSLSTITDTELLPSFNQGRKPTPLIDDPDDPWTTIQSNILQCQYLSATGDPRLAWNLIGFAIRMAQTLGLHTKTQGLDVCNRKRRETARKLWHGAIIMERMISLQVGIAPQTPNPFRVPFPTHLDTDYVDAISGRTSTTDVERPSMIEFLTACARLYAHVEDILAIEDELRIRHDGCAAKKLRSLDMTVFFKADSSLCDWNSSLPSFLRKDVSRGFLNDPIISRQRNICRIRYLHIRLRLYRPFLVLGLALSANCNCKAGGTVHLSGHESISPDSPAALTLVRDASFKCVATALEIVGILKARGYGQSANNYVHHESQLSSIPSFWENVDYLYACGIVLLSARLCPLFSDPVNMWKIGEGWSSLVALLEDYERIYRIKGIKNIAESCLRTLKALSESVKNPTAPNDVTAAFDNGTRTRIFQRMEVEAPAQGRAKRLTAPVSEMTDAQPVKGHRSLSWIESLPIDLED